MPSPTGETARRVAFIGTRDVACLPAAALDAYREAASAAARAGFIVVTGAAPGCDQLAATIAISLGGAVSLVLPWGAYEQKWVQWAMAHPGVTRIVYSPPDHWTWTESVFQHHPAGRRLAFGALALHARNYGIVSGADVVIAMPKDPTGQLGGTAHGLRVARALGVPIYSLWSECDRRAVADLIAPHEHSTAQVAPPAG